MTFTIRHPRHHSFVSDQRFPTLSKGLGYSAADMPPSQPVTETVILRLKEGVDLENVASGTGANGSPAVKAFIQLTDTVKSRKGFICQFWVVDLYLALSIC